MTVDATLLAVWWIGLVAALGLTLVALKLLALVLRTLADLKTLAERTAEAADGIGRAVAGPIRLDEAVAAAADARAGAARLASAAASVREAVGAPEPALPCFDADGPAPSDAVADGSGSGAGELGGAAGGPESS